MAKVHVEAQKYPHKCVCCIHSIHFPSHTHFFGRPVIELKIKSAIVWIFFGFFVLLSVFFLSICPRYLCLYRFGLLWNYDGLYAFCHLFAVTLYYHCIVNDELNCNFLERTQATKCAKKRRRPVHAKKSFPQFSLRDIFPNLYFCLTTCTMSVCLCEGMVDSERSVARLVQKVF